MNERGERKRRINEVIRGIYRDYMNRRGGDTNGSEVNNLATTAQPRHDVGRTQRTNVVIEDSNNPTRRRIL